MPRYDVRCALCGNLRETHMNYQDYDQVKAGGELLLWCPQCDLTDSHEIVLRQVPGVEWRTDGAYNYDNADPVTKYQREHFSESGDRCDKKLATRRKGNS